MKRFNLKVIPKINYNASSEANIEYVQELVEAENGKLMLYADYEKEITQFKKHCIRELIDIMNNVLDGDDDEWIF